MKQFEQNQIPNNWEEITIKHQLAAESLSKEYPDLLPLCIVSGYAEIPFDDVRKMPINKVKQILDALTFISSPLPKEPISEFGYKGEKYSVVEAQLKQEAQDFLTLTSIEGRKDSLLYVIAVLAKKLINGKYESLSDFDIEKRAQHFQDLPLTIANRIHVFLSEQLLIVNRLKASSSTVRSEYKRIDQLYTDYSKAFDWWGTFFSLADGDITRLSSILKTELETVLFWLQLRNRNAELDKQVQKVIQEETEKKMKQKRK